MASHTKNLELLKKDPVADGADTFNIETMLNENWDKIDEKVATGKAMKDHVTNQENPHKVTAEQVGAASSVHSHTIDQVEGLNTALSNKAPAGYGLGLGSGPILSSLSALDNARANGWYLLYLAGTGTDVCGYTYGTIRVDASSRGIHQTFYTAVDPAGVIHRVLSYESESWGPWEWENPPLIVGKEYQTTKRYNGAVVFQKLVNLGKAIDGAEIEVVSENYRINKISHAKGNPGLFPICQWDIRPELREWDFAIACDGRRIKIYAGDRATESSGNYVNVFVEYHRA